jgi:phage N-6-adenine-methyltransferase
VADDLDDLLHPLEIYEPPPTLATLADAETALKTIAVAEAAEKVWARAKDGRKLYAAIKKKLHLQAAYAVFRQDALPPSQTRGIGRGVKRMTEQSSALPALDPGAKAIQRWRERLCKKIEANKWEIDDKKLAAALEDAQQRCLRICEQENMGTIRGTEGTGEFERYTPAQYIEAAREVMGAIDLDPASCEQAQETVQATEYFTAEDDGLQRDWHGRVWLNPPYHRELAPQFINKLISEIVSGRVNEAIVLTNNSTDTEWFRKAAYLCDVICFTDGRIHFEVPNHDPLLPTQGQAFFYFGVNAKRFVKIFDGRKARQEAPVIGWCVKPI